MSKKISIVIPTYNEEDGIDRLVIEVNEIIEKCKKYDFEVLTIDNCSDDSTGGRLQSVCKKNSSWKYIRFTRNFGSEASIAAGLSLASGDAVIVLFSDLQDPPEYIPRFLEEWENGYQLVFGVYSGKSHEKFLKRVFTRYFYYLLNILSDTPMIPFAGDFRLYDRRVVDVICKLKERNRYMRGLAQWVGFKSISVPYKRQPRLTGSSKAPFFYLFRFAFSIILNFSDSPIKLFIIFGCVTATFSVVMASCLIVNFYFGIFDVIRGLTTTHLLLLFNLSFVSIGFGVIGEYISKIYTESKLRPIWIIDEAIGINVEGKELG